ncbi:hypothetical protein [Ktedonobacter robiniae]|uniref:hypothetical protein n=1 Tax=Ktedonobacter robiniae TaxID=2778365 RepID=UPI001915CA6C|nr:hypothetical protein [Ktedonobacter robiniae]
MIKAIRIVWRIFSTIFMALLVFVLVLVAQHDPARFFSALESVGIGIGASLLILGFIFWQFKRR